MALFPQNPGILPLGQFDMLDTQLAGITGGEVLTLTTASRTNTTTEQAAYDVLDGYFGDGAGGELRPTATLATTNAEFPLFLSDDGNSPDYLTAFGQVVGATAGLNPTGAVLGPHTAVGSGKVTLWDKPGLYVVTLDSCATDFRTTEGDLAAATLSAGDVLGFNATGNLCHDQCTGAVAGSGVANFIEYESSGKTASLVTTPPRLVGATEAFDRVKIWFHAGLGGRTIVT
jgi:hypothetical protein